MLCLRYSKQGTHEFSFVSRKCPARPSGAPLFAYLFSSLHLLKFRVCGLQPHACMPQADGVHKRMAIASFQFSEAKAFTDKESKAALNYIYTNDKLCNRFAKVEELRWIRQKAPTKLQHRYRAHQRMQRA
jgi:hypothetical protein